jgi:hypothetical protein
LYSWEQPKYTYVVAAAVEVLRKSERQDETQFITKIAGKKI